MKKVAIFLAAIAVSVSVLADAVPPTKEINWFGEYNYNNAEEAENETGIRRYKSTTDDDTAPIAPATLLLLGLGGAVVGTKVIRNRRKE
mgnify:CR=1 FL=1